MSQAVLFQGYVKFIPISWLNALYENIVRIFSVTKWSQLSRAEGQMCGYEYPEVGVILSLHPDGH